MDVDLTQTRGEVANDAQKAIFRHASRPAKAKDLAGREYTGSAETPAKKIDPGLSGPRVGGRCVWLDPGQNISRLQGYTDSLQSELPSNFYD